MPPSRYNQTSRRSSRTATRSTRNSGARTSRNARTTTRGGHSSAAGRSTSRSASRGRSRVTSRVDPRVDPSLPRGPPRRRNTGPRRTRRPKTRELRKKSRWTAYTVFVQSKLRGKRLGARSLAERMTQLATQWKRMSAEEKQQYQATADRRNSVSWLSMPHIKLCDHF